MIRGLFFIIALLAGTAAAQYRFDHWTADGGLPQNSVYAVTQTRDGYLWMATLDGLVRFDGVRFTVFNKSNSPGIRNNRFTGLFEDAHGDLWASTEESGVMRLHNGLFSSFGEAEGVPRRAFFLGGDADGNVTMRLSGAQIFHFTDGKFSPFDLALNFSNAANILRPKTSILYFENPDGNKFTDCLVDGQRWRFPSTDDLNNDKVLSAVQDTNGTVWILTGKRKLVRVENRKVVRVYDAADGLPKYPTHFVHGKKLGLVSRDDDGSLWLTDIESMRSELLLKKTPFRSDETDDIFRSYEIGEASIWKSYRDREGNLWFGTGRDGLYRARKQVVTTFLIADGVTDNNVYPIYEDDDGTLLVGTTSGLFTFQNGSFKQLESSTISAVQAIGKNSDGRIVVGSEGNLFVREAGRFVPFLNGQIPNRYLLYAIQSDSENALWMGSGNGLLRYKDGATTTFTTDNGLAGNDVKVIIEAKTGGLWIGTYGGLSRLNNGQLTSWTESDGLPSRTVRSLYEDADGTLWIGSYDGGLARFKDGKFTHFNSEVGLFNDGAFQILEDERRNFWISSNRGIYRVNRDELNEFADGSRKTIMSIAYGKSDGMLNAECNGGRSPAGVKTRDGRLWFPTQDGVAMIDPKEVAINPQPPSVVIESVKIDNVLSELPTVAGGLTRPVQNAKIESNIPNDKLKPSAAADGSDIIINPNQQNFEIQYTALSFINSENLRFKYRLEGLDEDWVDAGTRRTAYFSHVPPGKYTFRVIAANSDGIWNEEGRSVNITVLPPFYRTWWFALLASVAVAVFIFWIYQRRISHLEDSKRAQEVFSRGLIESQETERKRLAGELHDSLSQNLVIIKNRAMMSLAERENVEYAFEQIEEIAEAASETLTEVREIAGNLRPFQIDRLGLTKAIEALVRKANSPQLFVEAKLDNIDKILQPEMEINLYRILQESLNNIIKHSEATGAKIEIERSEKTIKINIRDNGRGFNANAMADKKSGAGFGLTGMNERARILGSSLIIETTPENGTLISLKINY